MEENSGSLVGVILAVTRADIALQNDDNIETLFLPVKTDSYIWSRPVDNLT